jgi:hypothetical protein
VEKDAQLGAAMISGSANDHSAADFAGSSNPLYETTTLQHVLSYVGPGHWYFLATVSSLWADLYAKVAVMQMQSAGSSHRVITCVPQMTLFSSVFASPSRVKAAYSCLSSSPSFHSAAGRHADIATLVAARELGLQYLVGTMTGAAQYNELAVVQFLHADGRPLGYAGARLPLVL